MTSGNNPAAAVPCKRPVSWLARGGSFLMMCLLMCGLATTTIAAEADKKGASWGITELMHSLAQVKESKATFVERKHMSLLKTPLEFAGTLSYTAPAHLEKITLLPKPESMVLDHDKLVVRTGAAQQKRTLSLQEYPAIWAFVESIRATLAGDLEALNRFYQVTLEGNPKQWLLLLRPLDPKMKSLVTEIRISGSAAQLSSIEIREAEGDYSVMQISKDDS